jgi:hypothetical protein
MTYLAKPFFHMVLLKSTDGYKFTYIHTFIHTNILIILLKESGKNITQLNFNNNMKMKTDEMKKKEL